MTLTFDNHSTGLLILRVVLGTLLIFHGAAKIIHPEASDFVSNLLANNGLPSWFLYGAYVGEVLAPIFIIVGIYCRYAAALIGITMSFALLLAHRDHFLMLDQFGGWALETQGLYLFVAISIILLGSGSYAIKPD